MLAATAVVAAVSLSPLASATTHALPVPKARVHLPRFTEGLAPYTPQVSCDPVAKPGVVAFRALMLSTYKRGRDGGIVRACGDGATSEHKEGRAWDWMLDVNNAGDRAVAQRALGWLLAPGPHGETAPNARRFGIMYIIWDGRIWGAYRPQDGWRPYSGASEHTDHIHFSFDWAGAMGRTSWWTGKVAPVDFGPCQPAPGVAAPRYHGPNPHPCSALPPAPPAYAQPGDFGLKVKAVQGRLGVRPATGFFGPRTLAAVRAFQARVGLPASGSVDPMTAFRLGLAKDPRPPYAKPGDSGARVRAVQQKLGVRPRSGFFGPHTLAAVKAFQKRARLPQTGVVDLTTAFRLGLAANPDPPPPAPPYAKPGDTSGHVLAVQRLLHVRPATGHYGPVTVAAVKAFQRRAHLAQTGVVDHVTAVRMHLLRA